MDPKVNMQLRMNEPRCCCCTRIRIGALVVAIIGAICSAIMAIIYVALSFISMNSNGVWVWVTWSTSALLVISLLLYIGVIYAAKKDKAWSYLPYLIIQGIELVVLFILTVILVVSYILIATEVTTVDTGHSQDKTAAKAVGITTVIIKIVFLVFNFVLGAYLYSVIWRAYMFTKDFVEPNRFGQVQQIGVATGNTLTP